jgi:chromosome partitioning protein
MPTTCALANQKGGTGKTTVTVHVGHELARLGLRVLVVDADPQATATMVTGTEAEGDPALLDVLLGDVGAAEAVRRSDAWGFDVLPSSIPLARYEQVMTPGAEFGVREALEPVAESYDVILIDCPPSLGRLTVAALLASHRLVMVADPAGPAVRGCSDLMDTLALVRRRLHPSLELGGVVVNRNTPTREAGLRVAELGEMFGANLWMPYVPARTAVSEALGCGHPVRDLPGEGAAVATAAFEALAQHFASLSDNLATALPSYLATGGGE